MLLLTACGVCYDVLELRICANDVVAGANFPGVFYMFALSIRLLHRAAVSHIHEAAQCCSLSLSLEEHCAQHTLCLPVTSSLVLLTCTVCDTVLL